MLRIRLELLRANSREGVDSLVRHLLVTLPGHSPSQEPDQELLRQWNLPYENKAEHKTLQSGGFMELLKVLLMWQDEPVYQKPPTLTVTSKEVARPAALAM